MTERALLASINQAAVGTLQEDGGLWRFQYTSSWLGNSEAFALSPHLPLTAEPLLDGASERPVQWYFDNLLPEETQRVLLAGDAKLDAADAFGLLAWYGAESAGSVTLSPPPCWATNRRTFAPLARRRAGSANSPIAQSAADAWRNQTDVAGRCTAQARGSPPNGRVV